MSAADDALLRDYLQHGSQSAFAALVERHLNLVYSVARRHVRSPQLAEEVAQSVFIDLARNARRITPGTPLVAWLHLVSRRSAIDVVRREARRHAREQAAATLVDMKPSPPSPDWSVIEPLLDEAVESLPSADRTAILLRFFANKSLREIGDLLGTSDDAAQKRVSRALEQLRTFFLRRGIIVTAAGLTTDLSAHAIEAAPASLGVSIAATAAIGAAPAGATFTSTALMTALQKPIILAAFAVAGGAAVYQASVLARQSSELAELHAGAARSGTELGELRVAYRAATAKLKQVEQHIDARLTQALPASTADAALESQMSEWLAQLDRLRNFLAQRPELNIPELELLNDQDWFSVAAAGRLESEDTVRRATSALRHRAESLASGRIFKALQAYVQAHDGMLPNHPLDLAPHFDPPINLAILQRYQMLRTGKAGDMPSSGSGRAISSRIMAPKSQADPELDAVYWVGLNGYGNSGARPFNPSRGSP